MVVPYVVGQWVRGERFYGRAAEILEILQGPRNALWLLGTRRIGKTSLLKQLEQLAASTPERGWFPLLWDLQGAEDPGELHLGFADALLDAEERFDRLGIAVSDLQADDLFRSLGLLRRKLIAQGLRLLLLCDEVEELIKLQQQDLALLRKLRHAVQAQDGVRTVLASTIRLWALADERDDTSPFLHGFTPPLYLRGLTDPEARALIRQEYLAPTDRPSFDASTVESVRQHCDNHPYLIQLVCKRLLESGDLDDAIEQVAIDRMVSYFFSIDFEMLSAQERGILRFIARQNAAASDSIEQALSQAPAAQRSLLQNLQQLGYIRREPERRFVLANYFFRHWLRELDAVPPASAPEGQLLTEAETLGGGSTLGARLLDQRYQLRRMVGEGATGVVYEAEDLLLRTKIAVKLLRSEFAGNLALLERFRQEILLARDLGHPNILRVYHLGQWNNRAYLTMQWVEGPTLAQVMAQNERWTEGRVAFIGARLAAALEAAHARQVLHRDIKPHNILLDATGEPLLVDFGLARLLGGPALTSAGVFLGTPNYVSPEQAAMQPLDERSDLYSLGVVLFEMATGRCPFEAETAREVLELHKKQPAPDPRQFAPELSAELAAIIARCLEKDPARRFARAADLAAALGRWIPEGAAPVPASGAAEVESGAGPSPSTGELLPLVYNELRRLARGFLSRERPEHTLQPTALVHEAYLRLAAQSGAEWRSRSHFLAVSAKVMRRLLIDHARERGRIKRAGGLQRVTFSEAFSPGSGSELDLDQLLALNDLLEQLARHAPRQAQVVELRFFAGMTAKEVAEHLGVSLRTVEAEWTKARGYLQDRFRS